MHSIVQTTLNTPNINLVNTPFHYLSTAPKKPKCHGVLLRHMTLSSLKNTIDINKAKDILSLANIVLHPNEKKYWKTLPQNGNRIIEWLLGRIAAKDVLRQWSFQTLDIICFPCDIEITQDSRGKPFVTCQKLKDFQPLPDISISHCEDNAFAALSLNGSRIGMDYEDISKRRIGKWLTRAFTNHELKLAPSQDPVFLLSLWTAKEAASKSLGTGLQGRWREWRISQISDDLSVVTVNYKGIKYQVRLYNTENELLALCQV